MADENVLLEISVASGSEQPLENPIKIKGSRNCSEALAKLLKIEKGASAIVRLANEARQEVNLLIDKEGKVSLLI